MPAAQGAKRNVSNTVNERITSSNDSATAASRSDCSAAYTASGIVCVRPGRLPANVVVAPNSPSARAHDVAPPAASDGGGRPRAIACVRPGRLPATVIVAPNPPSARAHDIAAPATTDGSASGSITRKNVYADVAGRVAADSR